MGHLAGHCDILGGNCSPGNCSISTGIIVVSYARNCHRTKTCHKRGVWTDKTSTVHVPHTLGHCAAGIASKHSSGLEWSSSSRAHLVCSGTSRGADDVQEIWPNICSVHEKDRKGVSIAAVADPLSHVPYAPGQLPGHFRLPSDRG